MLTIRRQQQQRQQWQSGFCHIRTRSTHTRNVILPNDLRADLEGRTPMPRTHLARSPTMSFAVREVGKKHTTTTKTRTHNLSVLLSFNSALISITTAHQQRRSLMLHAVAVYPSCFRYLETAFQVFTLNLDQTQCHCLPHNLSYFKTPGMYICSCCKLVILFNLLTATLFYKKKK